jgi:hypothetical protein
MRDYARGVVERSHWLVPLPDETMRRVRPPYGSKWPRIPAEKKIKQLRESFEADGKDKHGASRIAFSVLDDDFAHYVIGTNSWSTDWLSLRLDKPIWRSYDELIRDFATALDPALQPVWDAYTVAERNLAHLSAMEMFADFRTSFSDDSGSENHVESSLAEARIAANDAKATLLSRLDREFPARVRDAI